MKAKNFSGLWRAIVFLAAAITVLFSCSSCEPEEPPLVYETSITLTVEGITEQAATLVAEVKAGNKELQVVFEQLVNGKWETLASEPVSEIEKKIIKKEFTKLNPETDYKVRAYLKDANQQPVAVSLELEFTTPKTAAVVELSLKKVGRNQVILVASTKGRSSEETLGLWFEYFDGTVWKSIFSKNISGVTEQEVEQELGDLNPNTKYQVRAYLLSPTEIRLTSSNELDFVTLKTAMLELASKDVGLTSIDLSLELTPYDDTKVIISYQAKDQNAKVITSPVYTGNQPIPLEFKLENLERSTVYNISIKTDEVNSTPIELSLETYAVSDYDGNLYRTVTIGDQVFLKENLKTTHFLNGDPISHVTNDDQWLALVTPAYCYYNNDSKMGEKYGALYNWYVASDPRGLIEGFHVPTLEEWKKFSAYLIKNELEVKSNTFDWKEPNLLWGKPSGFEALPAGIRGGNNDEGVDNGKFQAFGEATKFWASSIEPALPQAADSPACYYGTPNISVGGLNPRWMGFSIRLVKN
ncbi:MAG: fibrobacter succinogenes major paralogous domain-containing protein [Peptococcales bacterium]|jgi:uncharacterized protein (TIGR02145 family)